MTLLYDHYAPTLYGVVLRMIQSEAAAQDVLQESMIKIWRYRNRYDSGRGRLFTWMLNICRNTTVDALRSGKFSVNPKVRMPEPDVRGQKGAWAENNVDGIGLENVLGQIDEKYRTVVDLIYLQGYTQREVEKELNIPLGTVKTRVKIA
ncbi:MAG: sigma-70 family RNA polymerase sigma factor, partial [Catalinimonas sp.]